MNTSRVLLKARLWFLALLTLAGCGAEKRTAPGSAMAPESSQDGALTFSAGFERQSRDQTVFAGGGSDLSGSGSTDALPAQAKGLPRKIKYTADVELVVEEFQQAEQALKALVKAEGGYISQMEVSGSPGSPRNGKWKVRIPVNAFDAFREAVAKLGELQRSGIDSQDVTEEFYDLEARIRNKKAEEEELLKLQQEGLARLQKEPKAKLEDLQSIRRELAQVRSDIERMQGRLKLLADLTELTTVTVVIHERKGYVPPTSPEFGTTVSRTWGGSLETLIEFGKGIVLFAVAVAPWVPLVLLAGVPVYLLLRRLRQARTAPTS